MAIPHDGIFYFKTSEYEEIFEVIDSFIHRRVAPENLVNRVYINEDMKAVLTGTSIYGSWCRCGVLMSQTRGRSVPVST